MPKYRIEAYANGVSARPILLKPTGDDREDFTLISLAADDIADRLARKYYGARHTYARYKGVESWNSSHEQLRYWLIRPRRDGDGFVEATITVPIVPYAID